MGSPQDTTPAKVASWYEALVALVAEAPLAERAAEMRKAFQRRTGTFHPEDPWFEVRSRAFWDDALTGQGFAELASEGQDDDVCVFARRLSRAHRGIFAVEDVDAEGARLVDLWSGAELYVAHLDEAQAIALEHAEGAMDARVVAPQVEPPGPALFVLPGALHHSAEALDPVLEVLAAARERGMETGDVLDALLRMELVYRTSSRVKTAFAYRVQSLPR